LQKLLARAGVASRRHAEDLIAAGRVTVNGAVVRERGTRVDPLRDRVVVDGRPVVRVEAQAYLALNKPLGVLTTADDPHGRRSVMDLVPRLPGLFPIGRLDADSEGLLLLTTDGEWAQRVVHPRYGCDKEYVVDVDGSPSFGALAALRRPMELSTGEWSTGVDVEVVRRFPQATRLRVVLHEGRNRQIRRLFDRIEYPVQRLVRVRVGPVLLDDLRPGRWRHLTENEVAGMDGDLTPSPFPRREGKPRRPGAAAQAPPPQPTRGRPTTGTAAAGRDSPFPSREGRVPAERAAGVRSRSRTIRLRRARA
jgi:pseudouridine synthase